MTVMTMTAWDFLRRFRVIKKKIAQYGGAAGGAFSAGCKMFTPAFAGMMDRGLIRRDDTGMLAFA